MTKMTMVTVPEECRDYSVAFVSNVLGSTRIDSDPLVFHLDRHYRHHNHRQIDL
jgi:hypothetical protein